jgi:CheY-like chemotaxis protein
MSTEAANQHILIVDDDEAIRAAFRLALAHLPYRLSEASDGEAGAAMAIEQDVDLVFLDLRMPRLDGVGALRRIRAVKPELPIYIATAFHREFFDALVVAREDGIHFELLRKPLERDQIIELTTSLLPPAGPKGSVGD